MKLYSGPLSLFTAKVRIALAEKELGYERVEVGWSLASRYEPHHPDVLALNPKGQVPVLVDGDAVVCDSTIIFEYLEDRFPETPLYPTVPAERARCRQLEAEADEAVFVWVWDLIEEGLYPPTQAGRDERRLQEARRQLARHYERLDKLLSDRDYLCGAYSVADIGMFVMSNAAMQLGAPAAEGLGNLQAWLQRMGARAAVSAEMAGMQRYLANALAG